MKYTVYNKLYIEGKPRGREFKGESAKTKTEAIKLARKSNRIWNNKVGKRSKAVVKINSVKKTGVRRKRIKKYC